MQNEFIFGYGSLVNDLTHEFETYPATLRGWRRVWRHTDLRPVAFLTADPDPSSSIDGVIMRAPHRDPGLQKRESAYDRVDITGLVQHDVPGMLDIHVFAIPDGMHGAPTDRHPVLLSYIDVVVQGYARHFGTDGVDHFFETTAGWAAPILDDRHAPRYPRHQVLTRQEKDMTDAALHRVGATVTKA